MIELPFAPGLGLDLSLPAGPVRGLVAYAHGGSFEGGSRRDRLAAHLPDLFLPRGIAFASISYRLRGQPAFSDLDQADVAANAMHRAAEFYPELRSGLLGPYLYRAVQDFQRALDGLRQCSAADALELAPVVTMGFSAGGLAAMGVAYGLDGLPTAPHPPAGAVAISALPPQPWRISKPCVPGWVLTARGDAVFPRAAAARAAAALSDAEAPVAFSMVPYGQHNRPIRELTDGRQPCGTRWDTQLLERVEAMLGG
ncbi:hypothetical protein ACFHYO_04025 [Paracoccus panacisoli]|uniref:Alpha/beta hydrolase n=1 Tax=Paracoccus panacisoli TaxID=1510163 RepID=A0ABV6T201_9RHOB